MQSSRAVVALCLGTALTLCSITLHAGSGLEFQMFVGPERSLGPNSVIVTGADDALLIDTQFLESDALHLVAAIRATGKRLTTVLITHAHPDHYFGLNVVRKAFPDARVLARAAVRRVIATEFLAKRVHWQELYAGDIPLTMTPPEELVGDTLTFAGQTINIVDLGVSESIDGTAFYFPTDRVFVAGDAVYSRFHAYQSDANDQDAWIATLTAARQIGPIDVVFPGHGPAGGPELFDALVKYLRDYQAVAQPGVRIADIAREMARRYPDYPGGILLWVTRGPGFGLAGARELGVPPELLGPPPAAAAAAERAAR
jgi:glyoxylase-like metal-dependent hydrolase (beta-lactamase superfamily II)